MYALVKREDLKTAHWTGGTTTQLAIYPATAEYQKFNFDSRISYATVEVEESTFTFMPGVTRHLMILEGSLEIEHVTRYKKLLGKFDMDTFSGEWPTKAKGRVTDFNLMTRGASTGKVEALVLDRNATRELLHDTDRTGIYLFKGKMQVTYKGEDIFLGEGDFILFEQKEKENVFLKAIDNCEAIIARIDHNFGQASE
jgi:uncharacterized protein